VEVAEVGVPLVAVRAEPVRERASERFFTAPRAAAVGVFTLFALTFDVAKVQDDGLVYFDFLRKAFGASTQSPAVAYQFGSAFWNIPFYLVSQLVAARGELDRYHSSEVAFTVGSNLAVVLTLYLGWRILRELDLPRGPAVLLLTLFGTPLFYYGALQPSYKHAVDTLYTTAAFWFVLRSSKDDARRWEYVAAGCCFALMLVTRYANVAQIAAVLAVFLALRLRRAAAWMLAAGALAAVVLFAVPIVRHIPYTTPPNLYGGAAPDGPALLATGTQRLALGTTSIFDPVLNGSRFSPTAPFKMLFTLHRGIFVWTPLTLFATIGFALLLRRERSHRAFVLAFGLAALGLLAVHAFWGKQWDGGGSFSQRFLTALFPFFLVGTAEAVRRGRRIALAVLTLCACWSLWLGLVQFNGYYASARHDSVVGVVDNFKSVRGAPTTRFHRPPPYDSLQNFGRQIGDKITERWRLYWRLVA
jgi:hypothetical protein